MATAAISDLIPRCAASPVAVCGAVDSAEIRLGLYDHPRYAAALFVRHNDQFAEQIACDGNGIFAEIELTRQFPSHLFPPWPANKSGVYSSNMR